jgi:hypothetical protein
MASFVRVQTKDGKIKLVALSAGVGGAAATLSLDSLRSVAGGAVNISIMEAGGFGVVGSIKSGQVEAPAEGWDQVKIYPATYTDDNNVEAVKKDEPTTVIKGKVETKLKNRPDAIDTINTWAGGDMESKDYLANDDLLEVIRDTPELRGAALRAYLATIDSKPMGADNKQFLHGVAAAAITLTKVKLLVHYNTPSH